MSNDLTIYTINNIETTIIFKESNGNKLLKDNNFNTRILMRYSNELFEKMFELFKNQFDIEITPYSKTRKNLDPEYTKKYDFEKIMEFDNRNGFYETCNYLTIFTKSLEENNNLGDYLWDLINQNVYEKTTKQRGRTYSLSSNFNNDKYSDNVFTGDNGVDIKYKINIPTLGRYTDKLGTTHKILTEMKIQHYLFCEEKEYDLYNDWIDREYCELISGENYSVKKEGSQHMRNYIMDYWLERGEEWIWMLDDNIEGYYRLYDSKKVQIKSKEIFTSIEHYISHFDNIGVCSHNFNPLITENGCRNCVVINGKHFTSLLLNLQTGFRFRFKYNEDHIYSIDCINNGFQTICFNHILYNKLTSGKQKGGNSEIYDSQGNQQGYNRKCDETIDLIKNEIKTGKLNVKVGKEDKLLQVQIKPKKGVKVRHLQIKYDNIISDKKLKKITDIVPFNSGLEMI